MGTKTSKARLALVATAVTAGACVAQPQLPPPPPPAPVATVAIAPPAPPPVSEDDAAIPIVAENPTWGGRTALVTLVEYSDFQCPFCKRAEATLAELRARYGPDQLRIVWKNNPLPFHVNAHPAAEAAMGVFKLAGADAFWKFHALAFDNQMDLGPASYARWAASVGVDADALAAGVGGHQWTFAVDRDMREAKSLGATGTPAFFINGRFVNGAQPLENFTKVIDEGIAQAQAAIADGTARDRVYAVLAAKNFSPLPPPKEDEAKEGSSTVFKIPLGRSPVRGLATAQVTVVEFADFQCPFCARVEPTLRALREKYGDKVCLVWKNEPLPFHPAAEPAAEAALEVRAEKGESAFWMFHDQVLADPGKLVSADHPQQVDLDAVVAFAVAAGADGGRVRKAIAEKSHASELSADSDTAEDFGARGTPHFFIDGRRLVGAQPQEKFERILDEEIAKTDALIAGGTKSANLYETVTRDGKGPPDPEMVDLSPRLPADDPSLGPASAKVVIHEWGDFQCPFTKRAEATVKGLLKEYGGRVRLVWHDHPLPVHPHALLAAQAAREAYSQKSAAGFWAMHDKLLAGDQHLTRDQLDGLATELHLDMPLWTSALVGDAHVPAIEADETAAFNPGTPAFVIAAAGSNKGFSVVGAQGFSAFHRRIEKVLSANK